MEIQESIATLFAYEEMGIRRFSKETYAPSFEKFQEIAADFDSRLELAYQTAAAQASPDADNASVCRDFSIEVADAFVAYIQQAEDPNLSKSKKEEVRQQHNLFMATYVLPHIMEMRNPYYQDLAKAIEKRWSAAFKNSKIKAATFETVAGGFQRKFFGFSI